MTTPYYNAWRHIARLVGVEDAFVAHYGTNTYQAMKTVNLALATFLSRHRIDGEIEVVRVEPRGIPVVEVQVLAAPPEMFSYSQIAADAEKPVLFWHFARVDLEPFVWINLIESFNEWVDTCTNCR